MLCFLLPPGVGLALEAAKTLQPGETLLVSKPLAAVTRSAEAAAALAAEAEESSSSSGSWVVPLDEEIEAVADELAAGGDGRALVGAPGYAPVVCRSHGSLLLTCLQPATMIHETLCPTGVCKPSVRLRSNDVV